MNSRSWTPRAKRGKELSPRQKMHSMHCAAFDEPVREGASRKENMGSRSLGVEYLKDWDFR